MIHAIGDVIDLVVHLVAFQKLSGGTATGNKIRKLEFSVGEARLPMGPAPAGLEDRAREVLAEAPAGVAILTTGAAARLGGDSIRAVLLVGTLRDAGYELSVRELMERPVVIRGGHAVIARPSEKVLDLLD